MSAINKNILNKAFYTLVKTEGLIRTLEDLGLSVIGINDSENKPRFSDLYAMQTALVDIIIEEFDVNIDSKTGEEMTNAIMTRVANAKTADLPDDLITVLTEITTSVT